MMLPGLGAHRFSYERAVSGLDVDRNPTQIWTVQESEVAGTLGQPSYRDMTRAAQADVAVSAVLVTRHAGLQERDRVTVLGTRYDVLWVQHMIAVGHYRISLSNVGG